MDKKKLRNLYYDMLRIRLVEEEIAKRYQEKEMRCPIHLCIGQEAVAAGVCANLSTEDYVLSGHRSHGHYLAKGGDLKAMMAELYGKETGCSHGAGGSMHLVDLSVNFIGATSIVASTIPIGVGTAFASVLQGAKDRVTAVFFGDAATEEGIIHESINFAALKNLPVIFVCENNMYSVYSPLSVRQPKGREIFELAKGHGIDSHQADGNDIVQVYGVTKKAVHRVRQDHGPVFLEFKTYRWREHCGPNYDNDLGYRTVTEFEGWKNRCPLDNLEQQMLETELFSRQDLEATRKEIMNEIEDAVAFAKRSPSPDKDRLLENILSS